MSAEQSRSELNARLARVRAAISALELDGVREYSIDDRSVTLIDLPRLREQESHLMFRINRLDRRMSRRVIPIG